jgi:osmotically-inducible protein OsmY
MDARAIRVAAGDGVVTLSGRVRSIAERAAAVRVAQRVPGVRAVADELAVVPEPGAPERPDDDLARAAARALEWNAAVPHERITITVQDGWVTLGGAVDWHHQRVAALRAVRELLGVRGVVDDIVVHPIARAGVVKAEIEAALRRHAGFDPRHIGVGAHEREVTLRGAVRARWERDEAERAARRAPGVAGVRNELVVAEAIPAPTTLRARPRTIAAREEPAHRELVGALGD